MITQDSSSGIIEEASVWNANFLRFTSFPSLPEVPYSETWWSYVTSDTPERRSSEPKSGIFRDEGVIEGLGQFSLKAQRGRIDWNLTPQKTPDIGPPEEIPSLGPYPAAIELFKEFVARWLTHEECPISERIAIGAILHRPVSSKEDGYLLLDRYLPAVTIDAENATDYLFQINRPRYFSGEDPPILLNRLTKWAVATIEFKHFGGPGINLKELGERKFYACQIDLDFNTDRDFEGQLSANVQSEIFQELIDLSREIVEYGDI